ncbi:hypothetical protein H4582DRAFT_2102458 [Lactarius indigo]|nr:hypothetical protein H4582DRAFT_2102458 [Lactarius indigo]
MSSKDTLVDHWHTARAAAILKQLPAAVVFHPRTVESLVWEAQRADLASVGVSKSSSPACSGRRSFGAVVDGRVATANSVDNILLDPFAGTSVIQRPEAPLVIDTDISSITSENKRGIVIGRRCCRHRRRRSLIVRLTRRAFAREGAEVEDYGCVSHSALPAPYAHAHLLMHQIKALSKEGSDLGSDQSILYTCNRGPPASFDGSLATPSGQHDAVVIGGGPGGYVAAIKAAQLGL